jgi:hypothetical protein
MEPLTIVEAFKIGKDDRSGLSPCFEVIAIQTFGLEFTPDTLHRRIIETIVSTRETDFNAQAGKDGLILGTGVLRTPVRMMP